ncbi:DMT family transporter [Lactobacillus sp. Sy-1]|uniref:DMT family transporter n=1 Tax=Lactobacillus sp. Sy-1 TaxID=2109645 RepID=UPI001C5A6AF4|nr:DMT family transporter [Lactobacillus sp. Sy-1]MBW1606387.1 DMT family transporter [Lactobacillus sp. Sy-1]
MKSNQHSSKAITYAVGSAALYALYPPIAKLLVRNCPPAYLSAFLYLGTGIGMAIITMILRSKQAKFGPNLKRSDTKSLIAVIGFNIAASILMNLGVQLTSSSNIALLGNFEIVATSIIAYWLFHEHISKVTAAAIIIITTASLLLSVNDISHFSISLGSLLAIIATICWGLENNFTRVLSDRNPLQVVIVKGLGVGIGSLIFVPIMHENRPPVATIFWALLLGFVAYGVSIVLYILAQRYIGAARTSAYYAIAPFISVGISFVLFGEQLTMGFLAALFLMIIGSVLLTKAN